MYYMNDKPLQYLLDSVSTTSGRNVQTNTASTKTSSVAIPSPGVAVALKKKTEETGKQMVEKKPADTSVYNVSTREKDIVRFDPKQVITDTGSGKNNNELIPGIPNTYTYIGGGVLGLTLLYMIFKD